MKFWHDEMMFLKRRRAANAYPSPIALGPLVPLDLLNNGSGEWTQVGGGMTFNFPNLRINTVTGGHGQYAYLTQTLGQNGWALHSLEKWRMQARFTCPSIASNTFGFSLGVKSFNGYSKIDNYVRLSCDSGSPLGSFYFYNALNGSVTQDIKGSYTLIGGQQYIFQVERNANVLTATLKDGSGNVLHTQAKTYDISSVNSTWPHNRGRFCIWAHGGTFTISNLIIDSTATKYADILFLGPSHYTGLYGGNLRIPNYVVSQFPGKVGEVLAGIDAGIDDMDLAQALLLAPRCMVLDGGIRNNIAAGMATGTWQSKLAASIATLASGGYGNTKVVLCDSVASNIDVSAHKTYIDANYMSYQRASQYLASKGAGTALNSGYNSGDNIHMINSGHVAVGAVVKTAVDVLI